MPVLDATYLIDLARNPSRMAATAEAVERDARLRGEPMVLPLPAAIEVATGARDPAEAFHLLDQSYDLVYLDRDDGVAAAKAARSARAAGLAPGWHDAGIAAVALRRGMVVVTRNGRDFAAMGCRVWDYSKSAAPPD